ncbi:class I mannose-6-phosphate isomerase [Qipengyuania sp. DSG2-2]|uniref:class I mannose-6-phosphate isomerase n=1 Tax=Qipengyuania sp. DGS2-2 TaxID=3349631 RepID=UPI0036D3D497
MSGLLPTRTVNKVWGRQELPAPFENTTGEPVGEIWFEPPQELDQLLVKYLFTSEKLSVQCHPSDAQAPEGGSGKEECWYVLHAEPGATLAIGLEREVSPEELRAAALDGSIEQLLTWHEVKAGDFFYLPAGTIHAIGPGLSLIEVQQNSDITYRLYDYGRPRDLHLDAAMEVAVRAPYDPKYTRHIPADGNAVLVSGPHFRLDRIAGQPSANHVESIAGRALVIPLSGEYSVAGKVVQPGECAWCEMLDDVAWPEDGMALVAA